MSKIFNSKNVERFFEIMQQPKRSQTEVIEQTRQAISCIVEEMHIGKVTISLSVPQSKLRAQIDNFTSDLFQGDIPIGHEPLALSYRTGDGGTAVFTFFSFKDYCWNEEEITAIQMVGNQIFLVFSQIMMRSLLKHTMLTDLSVGIPNVAGFMDFAGGLFVNGKLEEYHAIYLNIHNFKYVNKVLAYLQADEVMTIYSNMLMNAMKSDEIVARLGGDNFVALVRKENTEKFIDFISNVDIIYQNEDEIKKFNFGATIGVCEVWDLKNPGQILTRVSIAYQVARQNEGGGAVYYKEEFYKEVMQQKEVIARYKRALRNEEFLVYYQPKINAMDKSICGAEALMRWNKDDVIMQPSQFIPILEKDGSVCKIDFYVLEKVCALLDKCRKKGLPFVKISVNFSRKHVDNPDLVNEIVSVIDRYDIPHEYLEIELTESEDFKDYVIMSKLINDLKAEDISTSIDDFGTGYSSLNMLKMTNIDLLKIDKSFIPSEEEYNEKSKEVIMFQNIAHLAKELGIKIVAEGVETKQQFEYLADMGCDMIQGYYFDKPLPEEEFLERMRIGRY